MSAITAIFTTTIGRKVIMALTGIILVLFVLGHMAGNLLIFAGADAINAYAYKLHSMPAALLWAIRLFLLGCAGLHVWMAVLLTLASRRARPQSYEQEATVTASYSSRTMRMSGVILLAFIVFHIAHYTARVVPGMEYDEQLSAVPLVQGGETIYKSSGAPVMTFDVHTMMVQGFQVWWVSLFYLIAVGLLCMHLSHGFSSMFQTLGLRNKVWEKRLNRAGIAYGWIIFIGFASIPLAVFAGIIQAEPTASFAIIEVLNQQ
jgi:succinate dehydrogenase / fumarate reductase cytochrome b subunit